MILEKDWKNIQRIFKLAQKASIHAFQLQQSISMGNPILPLSALSF